MAIWARKKVLRLSKGFSGRINNNFALALRKVYKKLQYVYRDRRQKKRIVRRDWINTIGISTRELGLSYNHFIQGLQHSNMVLDRKILADLAKNEPYSFKAVVDEARLYVTTTLPSYKSVEMTYMEAIEKDFLRPGPPKVDDLYTPPLELIKLRNPEKNADKDYLRLSKKEEDKKWREEQVKKSLTDNQMKKYPRDVLDDNWDEE